MLKPNLLGTLFRHPAPDSEANGSWTSAVRPAFRVRPNYWTSGHVRFLDVDRLPPGGSTRAEVRLISPEAYPESLLEGDMIEVGAGSQVVALFKIETILDPVLRRRSQAAKLDID